ncbi:glyoxylate/hydroxypyruvate reductase A [Alcaligenaceae bacterium 429]|nr:glyoxylate/hydroxypyruvate reductase A [Alcaligenaceae bacterium 429]
MTILIKSGDPSSIQQWQSLFSAHLPKLTVRWWEDTSVDPNSVRYVLVWEPDPGFLGQFPNLEVIFSSGAGVDHITARDPDYPKHIPLVRMYTPESAQHMAEHVLMCCLMATRGFAQATHQQQQQTWHTYETPAIASDITVGIMGLGNLGLHTAQYVHNAGFKVIGWSRSAKHIPFMDSYAGDEQLSTFLQRSQIIVCLLPQTSETQHILNAQTLAQLPKGATIINVGRGTHLDITALKNALDAQHLGYAYLDVFAEEPLDTQSWLWTHPQVIISPHVAANAPRTARVAYLSAQITAHESGQTMQNIYSPELGY